MTKMKPVTEYCQRYGSCISLKMIGMYMYARDTSVLKITKVLKLFVFMLYSWESEIAEVYFPLHNFCNGWIACVTFILRHLLEENFLMLNFRVGYIWNAYEKWKTAQIFSTTCLSPCTSIMQYYLHRIIIRQL